MKRFVAESSRREGLRESLHGFRANRFRAVKRNSPAAQVELHALFGGRLPHAQIIGEVRAAAGGRLGPGYLL